VTKPFTKSKRFLLVGRDGLHQGGRRRAGSMSAPAVAFSIGTQNDERTGTRWEQRATEPGAKLVLNDISYGGVAYVQAKTGDLELMSGRRGCWTQE